MTSRCRWLIQPAYAEHESGTDTTPEPWHPATRGHGHRQPDPTAQTPCETASVWCRLGFWTEHGWRWRRHARASGVRVVAQSDSERRSRTGGGHPVGAGSNPSPGLRSQADHGDGPQPGGGPGNADRAGHTRRLRAAPALDMQEQADDRAGAAEAPASAKKCDVELEDAISLTKWR
jgi:hypothetical protein